MVRYILCSMLVVLAFTAFAQLQSPDEFLGYSQGEQFTKHHRLVDYCKHVAENSDRVSLQEYGRTNQNRPLILLQISTPSNLKNAEAIRKNNLIRTGLEEGSLDKTADKAIVWLSFGVHGNEAGASNASMFTLYELADEKNQKTGEWLENTFVLLDPCLNPDGFDRYTHWYHDNCNRFPNPRAASLEHQEPTPTGRVNHYRFDLNRDWAWLTQVESQQRIKIYNEWMPHIHADVHEQGYNDHYYFAPAAKPFHEYITQWQSDFQTEIGINHTKYFDKNYWLYFTKEYFDLFYPSYGDTYPTFNGAIGMTYEQAGHGMAGRSILMENGEALTLEDRIEHHKTTTLSTVETASRNKDILLQNFQKYFTQTKPGKYKSYIISRDNPQGKLSELTKLLDQHRIAYHAAGQSSSTTGFDYQSGKDNSFSIKKGDLIISANQPKGVLAQVLFDPDAKLQDTVTYDITAWSLIYAYNLKAFASRNDISSKEKFVLNKHLLNNSTSYAYAIKWESLNEARFLADLQAQGVHVRAAEQEFKSSDQSFGRGTLIITRADNPDFGASLGLSIEQYAELHNVKVYPITSGLSQTGTDLGSDKLRYLRPQNVAILTGDDVNHYSFGEVWHYFEQVLGMNVTVLLTENMSSSSLAAYTSIVLPEGDYNKINQDTWSKIHSWVSEGGKLITIGAAVGVLEAQEKFSIKQYATDASAAAAGDLAERKTLENRLQPYEGRDRRAVSNYIPGAIFKAHNDQTHPLGFALGEYYYTLKNTTRHFDYQKNTWNVGTIRKSPQIIGFAGYEARESMEETLVYGVAPIGAGNVVYLVDNPLFRSFWYNGKMLFTNALFMVGND